MCAPSTGDARGCAQCGAPLYVSELQACFRWRPESLSGARFEEQFREDLAVARRYAADRPGLLLLKRWRTARILAVYRVLAWLRGKRKLTS